MTNMPERLKPSPKGPDNNLYKNLAVTVLPLLGVGAVYLIEGSGAICLVPGVALYELVVVSIIVDRYNKEHKPK